LALGTYDIFAVTTTVWEQSTYKDFSKGKPMNVSLSSKDEVTLSRALNSIDSSISESRIWCLAQDSKENIYVGTGDKGKIYKIDSEGKTSLLFDSPETDILSIAIDNADNVYAGSSPDGIIYKIAPDRIPETFFKSEEKYIWSLVFNESGILYAGTGIAGKLYKIAPDGKGEVAYDSTEMHIKCLLSSREHIYAGSEGSGIIYKISLDNTAFVIYDTDEKEISSLLMDSKGNLYASAVTGEAAPPSRESPEEPPMPQSRGGKEAGKAVIYKITPDYFVDQLWESPDPLIYSMIADGENLIVGTGNEGNLYSVNQDGDWHLVADCEESQVLSLYKSGKSPDIWLATGNTAKLYKLSQSYVKEGTLESDKYDASIISKWGNIYYDAVLPEGTSLTLSTRSGNTEKPDDTWSKWSDEYTKTLMPITSPPARFIQWRAKISSGQGSASPILKRVSIPYLQKNLKPMVGQIVIASEQEKGEGPPPRGQQGRVSEGEQQQQTERLALNGKRTIRWQAKDPNNDSLEFAVYFRGIEENNWKLLKDEVKSNSYPIDTESFPDGTYLIKVIATDSPSNPGDLSLSEEDISLPFDIDNTPSHITEMSVMSTGNGKYKVSGKIEDMGSYIKSLAYSIDGGNWKQLFPSDQIFDSKTETFSFTTDTLSDGEHTIVIKVTDAAGNSGAAKTIIR